MLPFKWICEKQKCTFTTCSGASTSRIQLIRLCFNPKKELDTMKVLSPCGKCKSQGRSHQPQQLNEQMETNF